MLVLLVKAYHWRGFLMRTAGQRWLKGLHAYTGVRACLQGPAGVHYSAVLAEAAHSSVRPLFWISLVCTWPKFPFNPCPCLLSSKNKQINKISKEKYHCITICIMEAPKWRHERLSPPGKRFPSGLPFPRKSLVCCGAMGLNKQQCNYWSYPERCVELIETLRLMCMPWKATGNGMKEECVIDKEASDITETTFNCSFLDHSVSLISFKETF